MWDTKHRPLRFSDVLGQEGAVQVLKARLRNGTAYDTSYIFCGGSGQGKTTLARIFARAMLCQKLDKNDPEPCNECDNCTSILNDTSLAFIEKDAASQGNIDQVRKIVEDLPFAVFGARKRVYLFDECHRMSKDAQDVLLKPLEEKKLVGMFCTTEPEKVRGAIRSRCEEYGIRKVTREDVLVRMKKILDAEGIQYEDDAVLIVIDVSGGHVRDVVNRLEMLAQTGPITVDNVREQLNLSVVSTFYEILLRIPTDTKGALALIDRVCDRVTAEEVATGLAEAAMNSFRLANGMTADFAFSDKELGAKVSSLYGTQLTNVVEYFLRSRYITQVGLICDVVSLAKSLGGGGIQPIREAPRATFQPLVQEAQPAVAPASAPLPPPSGPVETSTPPSSVPAGPPSPASVTPPDLSKLSQPAPQNRPKAVPLPKVEGASDVREDGVGKIGSSDRCALTEFDPEVIPQGKKARKYQPPPPVDSAPREGREILTPTQWKTLFTDLWSNHGAPGDQS